MLAVEPGTEAVRLSVIPFGPIEVQITKDKHAGQRGFVLPGSFQGPQRAAMPQ